MVTNGTKVDNPSWYFFSPNSGVVVVVGDDVYVFESLVRFLKSLELRQHQALFTSCANLKAVQVPNRVDSIQHRLK